MGTCVHMGKEKVPLDPSPPWEDSHQFPSSLCSPVNNWCGTGRLLQHRAGIESCHCCKWGLLHCSVQTLFCTYKIYFSVGRRATRWTDEQIYWDSQDIREIKELLSCWRAEESPGHGSGNYFILRLTQLSWDLDISSGEFNYNDLRHYWHQLSASPLEVPASGAEVAGGSMCLHLSHCRLDPGYIVQADCPS